MGGSDNGDLRAAVAATSPIVGPSTKSDRDQFEAVYREQFEPLTRLASLLCDNRADVPDVVHEAFARWFVNRRRVEDPASYLRKVLTNQVRGAMRKSATSRKYRSRLTAEQLDASVAPPQDHLTDLIAHLPYRQRAAVVFRYYEGRTEADIAAILGCRPGTVKSLLSRSLAAMRAELGRDEDTRVADPRDDAATAAFAHQMTATPER